jgi:hypothetical protein
MSSVVRPSSGSACSDARHESLGQRVQAKLAASPLMALRRLTVEHADDRLFIWGKVASFYQKQQAQELVRAEAPGVVVVNEVTVV